MCARITLTTSSTEVADLFGLAYDLRLPARYNIAPSQPIPVLRNDGRGGRELVPARWGLVPHWNTDPKHTGFVNARAETAPDKPAFRDAFRHRRCLIPADGFYEWKTVGKRKQPFFFRRAGGGPLAYAGIWDRWAGPHGPADTVAILTTPANDLVKPLHDRMPAILTEDGFAAWLDPNEHRAERLLLLLKPFPVERMECWPVGGRVNSSRAEDVADLIAPVVPFAEPARWTQPTLFDVA